MRTRTLLLLAVVCGLAILAAGVVQLLRIASDDDAGDRLHSVGETVQIGDLTVEVTGYRESAATGAAEVRLGGVDDADGSEPFRLVVGGEALRADAAAPAACGATTVTEQSCTLTFPLGDAPGGIRVLRYERGDTTAVWDLGDGDG